MRYFIVTLAVSLCWLHQDWFIWPILAELNYQENFLSWIVAEEHEVKFGIPANVGFQLFLSIATAFVAFIAVWKAWPKELERWAEADGYRGRGRGRGGRYRPRGGGSKSSAGSKPSNRQTSRPESNKDSSERTRRRRGGRGRGGNSQSQPRAGE
jgi:hypothetical protein